MEAILRDGAAQRAERQHQLADSLSQTVVPVFIHDEAGRPEHLGSCVLVALDGRHYALTAGHVLQDAGAAHVWAAAGNGRLEPLPYTDRFCSRADSGRLGDIDIGLMPLRSDGLGPFAQCKFLSDADLDAKGNAQYQLFSNFYFVMGYPASRNQSEVNHCGKKIKVKSFHLATNPPIEDLFEKEQLSKAEHLVVEFDHKDMEIERKRVTPPKLHGVSGGGIFCISCSNYEGPLVAIATEHRKQSRILVGTRIGYFVDAARQLNGL